MTSPFGDKTFSGVGFPTPTDIPDVFACRTFNIPGNTAWLSLIMGCLYALTQEENWQQYEGGISRADAAEAAALMLNDAYDNIEDSCLTRDIAPYWQDAEGDDLVGEEPDSGQTWYGLIDGGDFQATLENVFIGAFVAQIAGVGAAIEFLTIAKSYRLAFQTGDWGGIVDIFVDLVNVGTVDTYSASPGLTYIDVVIPE